MTINGKTLSTVQALVTATSTNEGNFRTGVGDVLAQVNANQEALAIAVNCPQVVTTLTSGTSYTIPTGAIAIYIRASGGGGGGGIVTSDGDDGTSYLSGSAGAQTTVSNTALSIAMTGAGGPAGTLAFNSSTGSSAAAPNGFVQVQGGAAGGRGRSNINSDRHDATMSGRPAALASVYIKSSAVGGKVLTYSIGGGGAGATGQYGVIAQAGQPGFIELWIW